MRSHRGAQLCRYKRGNKATYTSAPFHLLTFNNSGKLLKWKTPSMRVIQIASTKTVHTTWKSCLFEIYKGFLFGSLNPDVPSLEEYLGEATKIIDMIVGQSQQGLEVLRGSSTYTYEGNWKLTAENGADGYHVSAVHWNYVATTQQRKEKRSWWQHSCYERRFMGQTSAMVLMLWKWSHAVFLGHNGQTQKTPVLLCQERWIHRAIRWSDGEMDDRTFT